MKGQLVFASQRRGAWAAVVLPWERRGDFVRIWNAFLAREDAPRRGPAWKRIDRHTLDFYRGLIEMLAGRSWIRLIVNPSGGLAGLVALLRAEHGVRLRVEDEDHLLVVPDVDVRVVDRRKTPGLKLARLLARAAGAEAPTGAQRAFAADVLRVTTALEVPAVVH